MLAIGRNLPFLRSWLAWALATVYTVAAALIIRWEHRNTGGGFINLRALGTNAVTTPSQLILGPVFRVLGAPPIDIDRPGLTGWTQLVVHVLVTAAMIYAIGWGIEWLGRRAVSALAPMFGRGGST